MPRGEVNVGLSNLSMLTLRRVHRDARLLSMRCGLPLPVVITWWLAKLPASVSPSEQVELLTIELELTAS